MSKTNTKVPNLKSKVAKPARKKKAASTAKKAAPAKRAKPKGPGRGRKKGDLARLEAHKGAAEKRALRDRRAFDMRCRGLTVREIAENLGCAPSTVHEGIEGVREALRNKTMDLAAQEREVSLQQIDATISKLMPFIITRDVKIETVKDGARGPIVVTVEAHDALVKASRSLCGLLDRKSKLLGLDAALKVEQTPPPPAPPAEKLENARAILQKWGVGFAPRAVTGGDVGDG